MKVAGFMFSALIALSACVAQTDDGVIRGNDGPGAVHRAGYQYFIKAENNQPGGYKIVADPANPNSGQVVEQFSISNKSCSGDDCGHNSVRSQIYEQRTEGLGVQPLESWYSWEIYLPADFPIGSEQVTGALLFTEFKETNFCASTMFHHNAGAPNRNTILWFTLNYTSDHLDPNFPGSPKACVNYYENFVADLKNMLGRWTRFELFMRWSQKEDGRAIIYVNGQQTMNYSGRTCVADCMLRNPFQYGLYFANASSLNGINQSTAYYRNVSRSNSKDTLAGH